MQKIYYIEKSVSSIIGIILMVVITVILSAMLLIYSNSLLQGISKVPIEGTIKELNGGSIYINNGSNIIEFYIYNLTINYWSPRNMSFINEFHILINGTPPSLSKYNGYSYIIINPGNQSSKEFGNLILPKFIHTGNSNYVANLAQIIIVSSYNLQGSTMVITYQPTVGEISFQLY
jgi:flagellin-like protein